MQIYILKKLHCYAARYIAKYTQTFQNYKGNMKIYNSTKSNVHEQEVFFKKLNCLTQYFQPVISKIQIFQCKTCFALSFRQKTISLHMATTLTTTIND